MKSPLILLDGKALKQILDSSIENTALTSRQKKKNQPHAIKLRPKAEPQLTIPSKETCKTL